MAVQGPSIQLPAPLDIDIARARPTRISERRSRPPSEVGAAGTGTAGASKAFLGFSDRKSAVRGALYTLLVGVTFLHCLFVRGPENEFNGTMLDTITNVFIGDLPVAGFQGYDHLNEAPLYSASEVGDHIAGVTDTYYHIEDFFPAGVLSPHPHRTPGLRLAVTQLRSGSFRNLNRSSAARFDLDTEEVTYNLTLECPQGPFSGGDCGEGEELWYRVTLLTVHISLFNVRIGDGMKQSTLPMEWNLYMQYDLRDRLLLVPLSWEITRTDLPVVISLASPHMVMLSATFTISLLLLAISVTDLSATSGRGEPALSPAPEEASAPGASRVGWWVLCFGAELINLASSGSGLYIGHTESSVSDSWLIANRTLAAAAAMACSIVLVGVVCMALAPGISVLDVMGHGSAPAARLCATTLIVFIAFSTLGTHLFGRRILGFSTLDRSFEILYSLMQGDGIHDTFSATSHGAQLEVNRFLARLYCYTAISCVYYLVLNQFFAVLEDAYVSAERNPERRGAKSESTDTEYSVHWGEPALSARAQAAASSAQSRSAPTSSGASQQVSRGQGTALARFGVIVSGLQRLNQRARGDAASWADLGSSSSSRNPYRQGGSSIAMTPPPSDAGSVEQTALRAVANWRGAQRR
eukprot:TRINITY_DN9052_c0_g1_i1.p1 TRINITY_DN9052_c0_g1~~TRINITY_DN9052_c0_g1_i1.p1  ORF type:complete len:664 (+),score=218.93 TRINITY_DN9052_c0_g1_i1:80-1993(+)